MEIKVDSMWRRKGSSSEAKVARVDNYSVTYVIEGSFHYSMTPYNFLQEFEPVYTPSISDAVNSPQHYQVFPDREAIEIIASSMTIEQFYGYCLGNFLKYRLRLGAKDEVQQELGKSNKYKELYEKYKHLCK